MHRSVRLVFVLILEVLFLVACQRDETPPPSPTLTPTRTLIPSATAPPPTATDTPYPTDTPTARPPTNTLSATLTQTWPETPTPTPTITRTPTRTPTGQPTPTVTGTPPTVTPTPTITTTPTGSETPTSSPTLSPTPTGSPTLETTEPLLWVNPQNRVIQGLNVPNQVLLYLSNDTEAFSIEVHLSFNDPDVILTVNDRDQSRDGVQILPGICPNPQYVQIKDADLTLYLIHYIVSQVGDTLTCNGGGLVLAIDFICIAPGATTLSIDTATAYTKNGQLIDLTLQDGTITCQP